MTLGEHATNVVDYAIGVAVISIIAIPVWFAAWWFIGFHPGEERHPTLDMISGDIWLAGVVFASPARASSLLLESLYVSASGPIGGLVHWVAACISVPLFWGTVAYSFVQLCRYMRLPRQRSNKARPAC
jgi:hypothetical protein